MFDGGADILGWLAETYDIPLNRDRVKGHREWNATACPGNQLFDRLGRLIDQAGGSGGDPTPTPDPTWDVAIEVRYLGLENAHTEGAGADLADAFAGERFQAEIVITNRSDGVIRDVELGYQIEEPFIRATNYVIHTDHPAHDVSSWVVNDADGAEGQPPRDGLGSSGRLIMHAFSPNESKRVLLELEAMEYSIGRVDHPDVRGWLRNATDVYGVQESFSSEPATNRIGGNVRAYAEMDVLSASEWMFDSSADAGELEGWSACDVGHHATLAQNIGAGMLALEVTGDDACVTSPPWTSIDAGDFDQLVIGLRSYEGPHLAALFWGAPGEGAHLDRMASFEARGDGVVETLVVPVGLVSTWSGAIGMLRIDPLEGAAPSAAEGAWHDIDFVFAQSSTSGSTSSVTRDFVDQPPVALVDRGGGDDPGAGPDDPGGQSPGEIDPDDPGQTGTPDRTRSPAATAADDQAVEVRGCSQGGGPGASWWLFVVAVVLVAQARRRTSGELGARSPRLLTSTLLIGLVSACSDDTPAADDGADDPVVLDVASDLNRPDVPSAGDAEVDALPDADPDVEPDVDPDADSDLPQDAESDADPDAETDPDADSAPDTEPDAETDPDIDLDAELDRDSDADASTDPEEEVLCSFEFPPGGETDMEYIDAGCPAPERLWPDIEIESYAQIPRLDELDFSAVTPNEGVTYWELRFVSFDTETVMGSAGTLCADAAEPVECRLAFGRLLAAEGFGPPCPPALCRYYVAVNAGDLNYTITDAANFVAFLNVIDSPQEAALVAFANDFNWRVTDVTRGGVRESGGCGYELLLSETVAFCAPIIVDRVHVLVHSDGRFEPLRRQVAESICRACF